RRVGLPLRQIDTEELFFFLLDDDPGSDHEHQAFGLTTDAGVLEQAADVGDLVEDGDAAHGASFTKAFDAPQKDGAAVGDADGGGHVDDLEDGALNGDLLAGAAGGGRLARGALLLLAASPAGGPGGSA